MSRERLDLIVLQRGLTKSREEARALIMEGRVFVNNEREDKPGTFFKPENIKSLEIKGDRLPYVSRGGLKIEKALDVFDIDVSDTVCLDIGSSTGGFTDCLLQRGASKVYAVDVGTNQLDYRLRTDDRVVVMEKTNFRYMKEEDLPEKVGFACTDVSFISLKHIFPVAYTLLKEGSCMVALVKPQFEAGREKVGKKGVVRDLDVHREVVENVCGYAIDAGFVLKGLDFSPITGAEGNTEYLLYLGRQ